MLKLFSLLVLMLASPMHCALQCHYCGPESLCPLPFEQAKTSEVECATSCLKFDGVSVDNGHRVVVRQCGDDKIQGCRDDLNYFGAIGTLCHCLTDHCNGASHFSALIAINLIALVPALFWL